MCLLDQSVQIFGLSLGEHGLLKSVNNSGGGGNGDSIAGGSSGGGSGGDYYVVALEVVNKTRQ